MLIKEFANVNINKKKTDEGLVGSLGGTLGGMALGQALVPPAYAPYAMAAGSMLGGPLGNAAEEKIKQMMGNKQQATAEDETLDEFIVPLIAGAGELLLVGLAAAARAAPSVLSGVVKFGLEHPFITTGLGIAATHPQETVDLAKTVMGIVNVVMDPVAAAKAAAQGVWKNVEVAYENISAIVGSALDNESIKALASAAIKYAIPAAGIVALLYGGKKLYDYIKSNSKEQKAGA